jgi:hypothetical protein
MKKQEAKRFFGIGEKIVGLGLVGLAGLVGLIGPVGFLEIFLFGTANANTPAPLSTPLTWHATNSILVTGSGLSARQTITIHPTTEVITNVVDAGENQVCLPLKQWPKCFAVANPAGSNGCNTALMSERTLTGGNSTPPKFEISQIQN